jgi:hypothetical protein
MCQTILKRNYKSEYFVPELFGDVPWDKILAFIVKGTSCQNIFIALNVGQVIL